MATTGDPWRILGIAPGASADEVRRAYRKLAKANHPDAAGEAALPRFLAIQAAYEQLAGSGRPRRPGARPGGPASPPPASPREPWRADPDRARASGRADARRPGARPAAGGAGSNGEPGSSGRGTGARSGPASGAAPGGGPSRAGSAGRPRRPSSGRASRKTATPYSTSYDPADEEPFEPGWSGGTWYGASSGTYWTINPKEYADPRKHGPEYQARARRAQAAGSPDDAPPPEPGTDAGAAEPGPVADDGTRAASSGEAADATGAEGATGDAARPHRAAWTAAGGTRPTAGAWSPNPGEPTFSAGPPDAGTPPPTAATGAEATPFRGPMLPRATTATGRFATALLGWPPLALFAGAAIGESTGCGRYAASCSELWSPGTWIVGAAILLLLLALPAVATWSAHGSVAALVIGVPSAVILSAAGGTNMPQASAPLMLGVLAIAYLAGLAYGLVVPRLPEPG